MYQCEWIELHVHCVTGDGDEPMFIAVYGTSPRTHPNLTYIKER